MKKLIKKSVVIAAAGVIAGLGTVSAVPAYASVNHGDDYTGTYGDYYVIGGTGTFNKYLVMPDTVNTPELTIGFNIAPGAAAPPTKDTWKYGGRSYATREEAETAAAGAGGVAADVIFISGTPEVYAGNDSRRVVGTPRIEEVLFTEGQETRASADLTDGINNGWTTVPAGKKVATSPVTFDFSDVVFKGPGVYRYVITEGNHSPAYYMTKDTGIYYLDVYVINNDRSETGLSIDGYVFHQSASIAGSDANWEDTSDEATAKKDGFVNEIPPEKLTISKDVTGNMGDKSRYFDFEISFEGAESDPGVSPMTPVYDPVTFAPTTIEGKVIVQFVFVDENEHIIDMSSDSQKYTDLQSPDTFAPEDFYVSLRPLDRFGHPISEGIVNSSPFPGQGWFKNMDNTWVYAFDKPQIDFDICEIRAHDRAILDDDNYMVLDKSLLSDPYVWEIFSYDTKPAVSGKYLSFKYYYTGDTLKNNDIVQAPLVSDIDLSVYNTESVIFTRVPGTNTWTFRLKDGESVEIDIPKGTKYTIRETGYSESGYTTNVTTTETNGDHYEINDDKDTITGNIQNDTGVTFINDRGVITPTGLIFRKYYWIVFPAAAAVIGAVVYKVRKRRLEYDEDDI